MSLAVLTFRASFKPRQFLNPTRIHSNSVTCTQSSYPLNSFHLTPTPPNRLGTPHTNAMTHNNSIPLLLNTLTNGGEPSVNTGAGPPALLSPSSSSPVGGGGAEINPQPAAKPRTLNFNYVVAVHRKMVFAADAFVAAIYPGTSRHSRLR